MTFGIIGIAASGHVQSGGSPTYGPDQFPDLTLTGLTSFNGTGTLGCRFSPNANGRVTGVRWYQLSFDSASDNVYLYSDAGTQLATAATAANTGTSQWVNVLFASPVLVTSGSFYRVATSFPAATGIPYTESTGYTNSTNIDVTTGGGYYASGDVANSFPNTQDTTPAYYYAVPIFQVQT